MTLLFFFTFGCFTLKVPSTSAPDAQDDSVVLTKKKKGPRQAQSPTKTVRRRKKSAADTSDPIIKRKSKKTSVADNTLEVNSLTFSAPG